MRINPSVAESPACLRTPARRTRTTSASRTSCARTLPDSGRWSQAFRPSTTRWRKSASHEAPRYLRSGCRGGRAGRAAAGRGAGEREQRPAGRRLHHRLQLHDRAELRRHLQRQHRRKQRGSYHPAAVHRVPGRRRALGEPGHHQLPGNTAPLPPPGSSSPASSPAAAGSGAPAGSTSPSSPASTASPPAPALSGQEQAILSQAEQLVNSNPMTPGEWHQITGNPYASSAAQQKCNNLPPYIWVPGARAWW